MSTAPRILDDVLRVAGGAANVASGLGKQIKEEIKARIEDMAERMDLVPREDLDHALAMIEDLRTRVEALEKSDKKTSKKPAAKKKATKKTTTKKAKKAK